jgi:hypothetical protein
MDQDLSDELRSYLITATTLLPADQRKGAHWVMSHEWFREVIGLTDSRGLPLLRFPMYVAEPLYAYGYPITVRDDAGVPVLEPAEETDGS